MERHLENALTEPNTHKATFENYFDDDDDENDDMLMIIIRNQIVCKYNLNSICIVN